MTAAIETLGPPVHEARTFKMGPDVPTPVFVKRPSMLTFYWPRTCMTLAEELGVDEEFIRRHFIIELYSHGHDDLARTVSGERCLLLSCCIHVCVCVVGELSLIHI